MSLLDDLSGKVGDAAGNTLDGVFGAVDKYGGRILDLRDRAIGAPAPRPAAPTQQAYAVPKPDASNKGAKLPVQSPRSESRGLVAQLKDNAVPLALAGLAVVAAVWLLRR